MAYVPHAVPHLQTGRVETSSGEEKLQTGNSGRIFLSTWLHTALTQLCYSQAFFLSHQDIELSSNTHTHKHANIKFITLEQAYFSVGHFLAFCQDVKLFSAISDEL